MGNKSSCEKSGKQALNMLQTKPNLYNNNENNILVSPTQSLEYLYNNYKYIYQ